LQIDQPPAANSYPSISVPAPDAEESAPTWYATSAGSAYDVSLACVPSHPVALGDTRVDGAIQHIGKTYSDSPTIRESTDDTARLIRLADRSTGVSAKSDTSDVADDEYGVDRILERWDDDFLLMWLDGSIWWVPEENIDPDMVRKFMATYPGFGDGIEKVLKTRKQNGTTGYRVKWKGRSHKENSWLSEETMDPEFVRKYKSAEKTRKRRRH
jgi:hypothetical protein